MNVEKRIEALQAIKDKLYAYTSKAEQIAEDLRDSFEGNKTPQGKKALRLAKAAMKLGDVMRRTSESVKL